MPNKSAAGLVEWCRKALAEGWGYVWGTYGTILTPELLDRKCQQYPEEVGAIREFLERNYLGKHVTDCGGLVKGYMWYDPKVGDVVKNTTFFPERTADGMFENAEEKGPIATIPEEPGLIVWHKGHLGVYVGDGKVIESHTLKHGVDQKVVMSELADERWTHWFKIF